MSFSKNPKSILFKLDTFYPEEKRMPFGSYIKQEDIIRISFYFKQVVFFTYEKWAFNI